MSRAQDEAKQEEMAKEAADLELARRLQEAEGAGRGLATSGVAQPPTTGAPSPGTST